MANFIPNSNIILLSNVPLDNTYADTLTFANSTAQTQYFQSKAIQAMTFSDFTYQRVEQAVRVPINAERLWNCNYLMFQNTNFGTKWFYAFVTRVEYRNPETTYLYFEIDDLQTWAFDYILHPCFVEREHVANDTIGLHTIPEGLEIGPYVTTSINSILTDGIENYVLATEVVDGSGVEWISTGAINGMIMGAYFAPVNAVSIYGVLDAYNKAGKIDAIIGIFGFASPFFSWSAFSPTIGHFDGAARTLTYTPKNNKLYTYPYCVLTFMCNGQASELRYENFNGSPSFEYVAGSFVNSNVVGYPVNYEGEARAIEHSLSFSNILISPFIKNSFQNWLAQNKNTLSTQAVFDGISLLSSTLNTIPSLATMNFSAAGTGLNQVVGTVENVAMRMAKVEDRKAIPNGLGGSLYGGDSLILAKNAGFYSYCRAIKPEYAAIVDQFFDTYGYKVNTVKIPEINSRQSWNYVKTGKAMITGSIPFETVSHIRAIFDRGITFWHGDFVGDYTRPNSIVGGGGNGQT